VVLGQLRQERHQGRDRRVLPADAGVPGHQGGARGQSSGPYSTDEVRACLGTDGTILDNYNAKINWAVTDNNRFSFQNTWAAKTKNARNASDTRPIETTYRQGAVPKTYGTWGWDVGPSPLWKAGDQHVFSDRLLADFQWSHLGNNFILDFHEDS